MSAKTLTTSAVSPTGDAAGPAHELAGALAALTPGTLAEWTDAADAAAVRRALAQPKLSLRDLAVLLSPAAEPFLETLAQRAHHTSLTRHGRVVSLYAPLYLSNYCVNHCIYCGFKAGLKKIHRHTLTSQELRDETARLRELGFRHILLVSGEDRSQIPLEYMIEAVRVCRAQFDSVSIEVEALAADEYVKLVEAGCDGVALYMETYHRDTFKWAHPGRGPKTDFDNRLAAMDRAARAGMRSLGIAALLGLSASWRFEALAVFLHAQHLMRQFWQSQVSVSFPRLRDEIGGFEPRCPVSDQNFVQMYCAMRLALPDAEFVISTREAPEFREQLVRIGVNRMSAGSKTTPGGYAHSTTAGAQFEISDERLPADVAARIAELGYEPVWKNWDRAFSGQ